MKSSLIDEYETDEKSTVVIATTLSNCVLALVAFVKAMLDYTKLQRVTLIIFRTAHGIDAALGNRVVTTASAVASSAKLFQPNWSVVERGAAGFLKAKELAVVFELLEDTAVSLESVGPETSTTKIIGGK